MGYVTVQLVPIIMEIKGIVNINSKGVNNNNA